MPKTPTPAAQPSTPATKTKKGTPPTADVSGRYDALREEYVAVREVADKAAEAADAKFEELVAFAAENGITEEAEAEEAGAA